MPLRTVNVDTGTVQIEIVRDGVKLPETISFNPADVEFSERFQAMQVDVLNRLSEFQKQMDVLNKASGALRAIKGGPDSQAISDNLRDANLLRREACVYMRGRVDEIFGAGTSQTAFGDAMSEMAIASFLNQVGPLIQEPRTKKLEQYLPSPVSIKRRKHTVK